MIFDKPYPTWIIAPILLFGMGAAVSFALSKGKDVPQFWRDFGTICFWVCLITLAAFLVFGLQDSLAVSRTRVLSGIELAAERIGKLTPEGQRALAVYLDLGLEPVDIEAESAPVSIGGVEYSSEFLRRALGAKRGQLGWRYPVLAGVNRFSSGLEREGWQRLRDYLVEIGICQIYSNNRAIVVLDDQDVRLENLFGFSLAEWVEL